MTKTKESTASFPTTRLRRLRQHPKLRDLVREHTLTANDFVLPLFIKSGNNIKNHIDAMPGNYQWSVDRIEEVLDRVVELKIPAVMLFGLPANKDEIGSDALHENGVIQQATRRAKQLHPDLLIMADLCLCEYTAHGHCGVVEKKSDGHFEIHNDKTLALLTEQAISLVKVGADVIAPSGMMDGVVTALRHGLDAAGYSHISILNYSVKYASAFYGPFREAADGAPQFGDRSTYQMDMPNAREALREAALDVEEGVDMLMVKPAGHYLDIIYRVKQQFPEIPLAAYQVSGEFSMIKAAAEKGWVNEEKVMLESLLAIKRAGADFIITYYALDAAQLIGSKDGKA